jgi:hypothetical protein
MIEEKKYKLFGPLANRISKHELYLVNSYFLNLFKSVFNRIEIPRNLNQILETWISLLKLTKIRI